MATIRWRKTPCDSAACVEVGKLDYGDFAIRSSQFRARKVVVTRDELGAFLTAVKNGHFDSLLKEIQ